MWRDVGRVVVAVQGRLFRRHVATLIQFCNRPIPSTTWHLLEVAFKVRQYRPQPCVSVVVAPIALIVMRYFVAIAVTKRRMKRLGYVGESSRQIARRRPSVGDAERKRRHEARNRRRSAQSHIAINKL
jgi:hypothetical protein